MWTCFWGAAQLLIFGRDKRFKTSLKYCMNFSGEGSVELLHKLEKIYEKNISPEWKASLRWDSDVDKISSDEIDLIGLKRTLLVEIPIILKSMSEHIVEIKTPMNLKNGAVLLIDDDTPFFITIINELGEKGVVKGIINGIDETFKMKVRRFVNDLIQIPKTKEEQLEKQKYQQLNIDKFMEKLKLGRRKVDELS